MLIKRLEHYTNITGLGANKLNSTNNEKNESNKWCYIPYLGTPGIDYSLDDDNL